MSSIHRNPALAPQTQPVKPSASGKTQTKGQAPAAPTKSGKSTPAVNLQTPQDLFKPAPAKGKSATSISLVDAQPSAKTSAPAKVASTGKATAAPIAPGTVVGNPKGTGYFPHNNKMEGGHHDMQGKPLKTIQDFLEGKSSYVSVALDKDMYEHIVAKGRKDYERTGKEKFKKYQTIEPQIKYGDTFRIPELEKKYGRQIIFKAVDTGGAFTGKRFNRIDIATRSAEHSHEKTVNGPLTLIKQ